MSSSTVITGQPTRGQSKYFEYLDGMATTKFQNDETQLRWDLTDELTGPLTGLTVSSAAYQDHGVTTSGKSVSSPVIICTVTGCGYTIITATLSNGFTIERKFYYLEPDLAPTIRFSDYGQNW